MKKPLDDVHAWQTWRDRDKRELSGNRCVKVTATIRDDKGVGVKYRAVLHNGEMCGPEMRSKYDRFQRAFELMVS